VTARAIIERRLAVIGLSERIDDLEQRIILRTSIGFEQRNPRKWARNVHVPTFLYQVHDDILTHPSDVQPMLDNIPVAEKKLQCRTLERESCYLRPRVLQVQGNFMWVRKGFALLEQRRNRPQQCQPVVHHKGPEEGLYIKPKL
jgi:hypothetical protein